MPEEIVWRLPSQGSLQPPLPPAPSPPEEEKGRRKSHDLAGRVIEALASAKRQWDDADRASAESATIITGRIDRNDNDGQTYCLRLEVSSGISQGCH